MRRDLYLFIFFMQQGEFMFAHISISVEAADFKRELVGSDGSKSFNVVKEVSETIRKLLEDKSQGDDDAKSVVSFIAQNPYSLLEFIKNTRDHNTELKKIELDFYFIHNEDGTICCMIKDNGKGLDKDFLGESKLIDYESKMEDGTFRIASSKKDEAEKYRAKEDENDKKNENDKVKVNANANAYEEKETLGGQGMGLGAVLRALKPDGSLLLCNPDGLPDDLSEKSGISPTEKGAILILTSPKFSQAKSNYLAYRRRSRDCGGLGDEYQNYLKKQGEDCNYGDIPMTLPSKSDGNSFYNEQTKQAASSKSLSNLSFLSKKQQQSASDSVEENTNKEGCCVVM